MTTSSLEPLTRFRKPMYQLFTRRRDALFDLTDALLTTGPMLSPAHLSLAACFQRGWGSVYDALVDGRIDHKGSEELLAQHPLEAGEPIYAVDASVCARCCPENSPERAFYYHASRHSAGQPIVAGWAYHWVAQISFAHNSWTAPRKIRRLKPDDNVNLVAVEQIKEFLHGYPDSAPLPIFVFDAGYEPGQLAAAWGSLRAAALTRLRAGRCFYADPADQASTGRPHDMSTNSSVPIPPPGQNQIKTIPLRIGSQARYMYVPGTTSMPFLKTIPSAARVAHGRLCEEH